MADPAKIILGDTTIPPVEQPPGGKGFFRNRKNRQSPPPTHCENCGALLYGHYCAQCGQPAIDYHRSIRHVLVDLLDEFLNWDSKFFVTVGLLFVKPWQLTNEFRAGRRVRYVHPLRVYLLASVLFFLAVNFWAKSIHLGTKPPSSRDLAEIQANLQNENLPPDVRDRIEKALEREKPSPEESKTGRASTGKDTAPGPYAKTEEALKKQPDQKNQHDFGPLLQLGPESPTTPFEKWLETRAKEKLGEHGTKAQLFLRTVISNLPYMMLCCIPLFAFVLKILYIRRRIFYIDHLIYALHIHSFAYLYVILVTLIGMGLNRTAPGTLAGWIIALLWVGFVVQIFRSIRRVYRQGWIKSFVKFWLGGAVYFVILMLGFIATFFITLAVP